MICGLGLATREDLIHVRDAKLIGRRCALPSGIRFYNSATKQDGVLVHVSV